MLVKIQVSILALPILCFEYSKEEKFFANFLIMMCMHFSNKSVQDPKILLSFAFHKSSNNNAHAQLNFFNFRL